MVSSQRHRNEGCHRRVSILGVLDCFGSVLGSVGGLLGGLRVSQFTGVAEEGVTGVSVSRAIEECLGVLRGCQGSGGVPAHQGGSDMRNCPNRHCSSCEGGRAPSHRDQAGHSPPPRSPALPVPGSGRPQSPQGPQHAGPAGSPINSFIATPQATLDPSTHSTPCLIFPHRSLKTPKELPARCHHQCDLTTIQDPLHPPRTPAQCHPYSSVPCLNTGHPRTTGTTLQCQPLLSFPPP